MRTRTRKNTNKINNLYFFNKMKNERHEKHEHCNNHNMSCDTNPLNETEKLHEMSEEQQVFFNVIARGENAIGDACAGSGKSTTILSIATALPNIKFVQLTYNSMLCNEIKQKVKLLGLQNIKVYTYHSLVVRYYDPDGHTDTVIRKTLNNNSPPTTTIEPFQVFVLDETQDMTFLYFRMMVKFCRDMGKKIQLLILGDYMQGLYEFKGADTRFLTKAHEIWANYDGLCSPIFNFCTLKMSYRITKPMAEFINNVMLGETRLLSCKDGEPVVYVRRPTIQAEKYIIHTITTLLNEGAEPADFFVLGASVKGSKTQKEIHKIEHALVENNVPCHVPIIEDGKIDERVIHGKVVFATFHSVKGRQRKYVFVVDFNDSSVRFVRNLSPLECPNTLYVATTRATHRLFLIELNNHKNDRPLKFLKMNHWQMEKQPYVKFNGVKQILFHDDNNCDGEGKSGGGGGEKSKPTKHMITPTELIKFIPDSVLEDINPIIDRIFVKISSIEEEIEIDIPTIIKTSRDFYEEVSDLNGIAIPMMYFDFIKHDGGFSTNLLLKLIQHKMETMTEKQKYFLNKFVKELPTKCESIAEHLFLSNVYSAVNENLYFKLKQIGVDEYDWISQDVMTACFQRMNAVLKNDYCNKPIKIEETIIHSADNELHMNIDEFLSQHFGNDLLFRFTARLDLITEQSVWEIKCTNSVTQEHMLQVAIYAWIWRMTMEDVWNLENIRDFKIFNVKTGEVWKLCASTAELNQIVVCLLKGKYCENKTKPDAEFIEECRNVFKEKPVFYEQHEDFCEEGEVDDNNVENELPVGKWVGCFE